MTIITLKTDREHELCLAFPDQEAALAFAKLCLSGGCTPAESRIDFRPNHSHRCVFTLVEGFRVDLETLPARSIRDAEEYAQDRQEYEARKTASAAPVPA